VKYLAALAAAFLAAVLTTSLSPYVKVLGVAPDFVLIFAACWAMVRGQGEAMFVVPVAALLRDLTTSDPLGLSVLALAPIVFLALLRERLDTADMRYEYLDGKTRDRQSCVDRFQTDASSQLFLISLKAGGHGLNLTAADYVFILDPWWNPAVEAQAIDRAHRIGQERRVIATRIVALNTIETKILELQESKRALAEAILGQDQGVLAGIGRAELEMLLA